MLNKTIPHQDITYKIIGCAMRVHRHLQRGLREKHYQRALTAQMRQEGLVVSEEYCREIYDGDVFLGQLYLDHWVNECVVVEDKAVSRQMENKDVAQVLAYLAVTGAKVGLFLNFGRNRLEYRRILPSKSMQDWQKEIQKYLWKPDRNSDLQTKDDRPSTIIHYPIDSTVRYPMHNTD